MLASSSLSVKIVCLLSDKMKHFLNLKIFHKLALLQILKECCITIKVIKKRITKGWQHIAQILTQFHSSRFRYQSNFVTTKSLWMIMSSIDIEVIKTVFNFFFFFMKKVLNIENTNKKYLSNIQPNISIRKKSI